MLYVWPPIDLPLDELTEVARRLVPLTEGLGLEQIVVSGRFAGLGADEPVETVMRLGYEAGRGLTVRLTPPPTAPMQPLDDYTRKLIQTRRRGLVYPYELVPLLCGERRHVRRARPRRATAGWCPSSGRRARTAPASSSASSRTPTERYPEGDHAGRRARRPDAGDGLDHRGRVPARAGGDRPGRRDGRADRVVRPVGRGQDRHGLRQREPRLGGAGAAPARRAHPGAAARSTSSSPASTSAPSRTGTPRRRC